MEKKIDAVVFDLDGVITDTAHYHFLAWKSLADRLGIMIDETFNEKLKGVSRLDSLELILQEGDLQEQYSMEEKEKMAEEKNELYCEYLKQLTPNDILPGIKDLITIIKAEGIGIGLASVSKNAPMVLKALELENVFDYCADAAKIKRSKPDPEIFLTACNGLHASPQHSIGIEDALAGITAIKASGMFAVGVGNNLTEANYMVERTEQLNWEVIKREYM